MTRFVRDGQAGVTLIEVMAMLAVVGVASGAAMMIVGDRGANAEAEAVRLARLLSLGVDEALISGRPLVMQWDATGYSFGQLQTGQQDEPPQIWPPAMLAMLGQRHDLAKPLELVPRNIEMSAAMVLPTSGAAAEVTFDITGSDTTWMVTFDGFSAVSKVQESP